MKKLLPLFVAAPLFALESQTIHSSILGYYENKTYTHSKQKINGEVYGVGGDIHLDKHAIRFTYEYATANTKQPPLTKDLTNEKLFFQYKYNFIKKLYLHLNYLNVLDDNIAITSGGKGYGTGVEYNFTPLLTSDVTQYIIKYDDFKTYQSDIRVNYTLHYKKIPITLSFIGKYIQLQDIHTNSFTKNAQKHYFTPGIKLHTHYKSYHFGAAAYFGKRAFAVMNDGFKIQHHAMEFTKTYALGIGKSFRRVVARVQYAYNEATELPINNPNVKIENIRLLFNYKL